MNQDQIIYIKIVICMEMMNNINKLFLDSIVINSLLEDIYQE